MSRWSTDFETGLLDDYDFTIVHSFFAPDQKYMDGNVTLLQWEGTTDNEDVREARNIFPLGKGWSSKDGGQTIVHDSGKDGKYFVRSSLIAQLIDRCVNQFGIGDLLDSRGGPFESAVWTGLTFHMKSETVDYGPGIGQKSRVFPSSFVSSGPVAAQPELSNGSSLKGKVLAAMAPFKAKGDWAGAQEAALQIPGVADDAELVELLLDETGLYAKIG